MHSRVAAGQEAYLTGTLGKLAWPELVRPGINTKLLQLLRQARAHLQRINRSEIGSVKDTSRGVAELDWVEAEAQIPWGAAKPIAIFQKCRRA